MGSAVSSRKRCVPPPGCGVLCAALPSLPLPGVLVPPSLCPVWPGQATPVEDQVLHTSVRLEENEEVSQSVSKTCFEQEILFTLMEAFMF